MAGDVHQQGQAGATRRVRAALMNKVCGGESMFTLATCSNQNHAQGPSALALLQTDGYNHAPKQVSR